MTPNPEPASSTFTIAGPILPGRGIYIEREADRKLLQLCRSAAYVSLFTPPYSGKTSLLMRAASRLAAEGARVALLDMARHTPGLPADAWYLQWLMALRDQLRLELNPTTWWHAQDEANPQLRLRRFFEELARQSERPLVIMLDSLEHVQGLPFASTWLAVLRDLYDGRAHLPELARCCFVFAGRVRPGDLAPDALSSPFAIGTRLILPDFQLEQALPLAQGLPLPEQQARELLRHVLDWSWGQPYLTQRICHALSGELASGAAPPAEPQIRQVVTRLFLKRQGQDDPGLRQLRKGLLSPQQVEALALYQSVLDGDAVPPEPLTAPMERLLISGLVRRDQHGLQPRNPIYRHVFDRRWSRQAPLARRPLRRLPLLLLALLALLLFGGGAWWSLSSVTGAQQAQATAEAQQRVADQSREQAERRQQTAEAGQSALQTAQAIADAERLAAKALLEPDSELAVALAASAYKLHQNQTTEDTLRKLLRASQIHAIWREHSGDVNAVAWSPDGSQLLSGDGEGALLIWDVASGTVAQRLLGHRDSISHASWSPDGRAILSGADDGTLWTWSRESGERRTIMHGHSGPVTSARWSSDGQRILSVGDTSARLWDAETGKQLFVAKGADEYGFRADWSPNDRQLAVTEIITSFQILDALSPTLQLTLTDRLEQTISEARWSPDGRRLLTIGWSGMMIWDPSLGITLTTMTDAPYSFAEVDWSPDGKLIATWSYDRAIRIWDAETGRLRDVLRGVGGYHSAIVWSPDSRLLISSDDDGVISVWNVPVGERILQMRQEAAVVDLALSPDQSLLASAGDDSSVYIWSLAPRRELFASIPEDLSLLTADLSDDGRRALLAEYEGAVRILDLESQQPLFNVRADDEWLAAVSWSPDEQLVAAGSYSGTLTLYDASSGAPLQTMPGEREHYVSAVAWSPDSARVVSIAGDGVARIWEAESGKLLQRLAHASSSEDLEVDDEISWEVSWSAGGSYLATTGDGIVRIWDTASGKQLLARQDQDEQLWYWTALWGPSDELLILDNDERSSFEIWNVPRGEVIASFGDEENSYFNLVWSPDGLLIAGYSYDSSTIIWDARSGEQLRAIALERDDDYVADVLWGQGGELLISTEERLRIYDSATGELRSSFGFEGGIAELSWGDDGKTLLILGDDGAARSYYRSGADVLALAEQRVTRRLTSEERQRFGLLKATAPTPTPRSR